MGLDVSSKVIIGIKLDHIVQNLSKTKYDENNGTPYKFDYDVDSFAIGSKIIAAKDELFEYFDEKYIFYSNYHNLNTYFLGISIAETSSHRSYNVDGSDFYDEIDPQTKALRTNELKKYLISKELDVESQLKEYLILYTSY